MRRRKCLILCTALLSALLGGCGGTDHKETEMEPETEAFAAEGRLVRVEYSFYSGTMWGEDFEISVGPGKIYFAHYFSKNQDGYPEAADKTDEAITPEQWSAIEEAALRIVPLLQTMPSYEEETSGQDLTESFLNGMPQGKEREEVMDGGDKRGFYLTWEKDGEEKRIAYYHLNDRRFLTLTALLQEAADPIGREIPYYEDPVVTGVFFKSDAGKKSNRYSYQCTPKTDASGEYYYYAHYTEDGTPVSLSETVYRNIWEEIAGKLSEAGVASFPKGNTSRDKEYCYLYYSDGKQAAFVVDKETQKELKAFFEGLTVRILADKNGEDK